MPRRSWAKLGVALALLLHLGIALTPPPNNIAEYGTMSALRLAWLARTPSQPRWPSLEWLAVHASGGALLLAILAARSLSSCGAASTAGSTSPRRTSRSAICSAASIYPPASTGSCAASSCARSSWTRAARRKGAERAAQIPTRARAGYLGTLFVVTAVWYAFGTIVMGVLDVSSPNMFSNVRMQGGSNHLLLPTALLQEWHRDHGATSAYSGGVVRVEHQLDLFLDHPSELTPVLGPPPYRTSSTPATPVGSGMRRSLR